MNGCWTYSYIINNYWMRRRPRLITLTETLIIPDITKAKSNNCFIIHCFEINNDKYAVARYRFDIALRNHASRARKLQISHLFASR